MQCRNRLIAICISLLVSFQLSAQDNSLQDKDVTGLWKGYMHNDTTQKNLRYEIAISEENGKLFGYSHTYFIVDDKEYHGVKKLKVKRDGNKLITEEIELIIDNYPIPPAKGVFQQNTLTLEIKGDKMALSGNYATNRTKKYSPATGFINVERNYDYSQSALVPHLQELKLAKNLSFLKDEPAVPEDQSTAILKPVATEEEVQLIVSNAKKQEQDLNIKPSIAIPTIKEIALPSLQETTQDQAPSSNTILVTKETEISLAKTTSVVQKIAPVADNPLPAAITTIAPVKIITTEVAKKIEPDAVVAAADLNSRTIKTIKNVNFKSDSLVLSLYDNGEVDGDTVSVVMNGKVVMPMVGLNTTAVKKVIYTKDAGDSIQLIMYAETLGSIPPNTGLLIVYDGKDRYEIRFSGDMQQSAAIVFRRKKETTDDNKLTVIAAKK